MRFGVVTLFPELLEAFLGVGVVGRAVARGHIRVTLYNPRDFTVDKHRTVDDRPFGGGPGMVMKPEPLMAAIDAAKAWAPQAITVYLSPQGKVLTQTKVREWQPETDLILVAGRYEGIDERVIESHVDEQVSIGDYVLSGGEVAAMVVIDAVSRLRPDVLGHPLSAQEDSFGEDGLLDCPHYTRPERLGDEAVPGVLLSGDHQAIARWRREMTLKRTRNWRPELLVDAELSDADIDFLRRDEQ